jgi:uncharacterized protein
MLTLISPAKTLDYESAIPTDKSTAPALLKQAAVLAKIMKTKSARDLAGMMKISPKLADLNHDRFQTWTPASGERRQSIYAFKGDVYLGLQAETLSARDLNFAQKHLRILSGLYGLLRPLDLIKPYRLEMGTRLKNKHGEDLYDFWQDTIAKTIKAEFGNSKHPHLINLASNEYFKAVDLGQLSAVSVINPIFKDTSNGQLKVISFYAKRARGLMAQYIIKQRITQPEKLKSFDIDGYRYHPDLSSDSDWVFAR